MTLEDDLKRWRSRALAGGIAVQKAAAATAGGLFVDQQKAMGGPGAIDGGKWLEYITANRAALAISRDWPSCISVTVPRSSETAITRASERSARPMAARWRVP